MSGTSTSGGGAATHAGTNYQDYVAAWVSVQILAEQDVTPPWTLPAAVTLEALHAEAPHSIDDLIVHTSSGGRALAQVKHTVTLAKTANSPLGSTIAQFVAEYHGAPTPFDPQNDRFILITSPQSSASIKQALPAFLQRMRTSSQPDQEWTSGSQDEQNAAQTLRDHITREWQILTGAPPSTADLIALTRLIQIHVLDVDPGGQAAIEAKNTIRQRILKDPTKADSAWNTLITANGIYAANRQRADRPALQSALTDSGLDLQAQRSYRDDIERLRARTTMTLLKLLDFSRIRIQHQAVTIERSVTADARNAAREGHLLVLGMPGAGKSGTLYAVAHTLQAQGADVVLLAVDDLEAASTGTLRNDLGLTHELSQVLRAWPGTEPAYLIIDALDAARTAGDGRTLHTIMEQVIASTVRWRVIASVRKFDLRYNTKLQTLFRGNPPTTYTDTEFSTTRHVNVPVLTDEELAQLAEPAPTLNALVANAPPALKDLLHIPFNLRLLAELLAHGVTTAELEPLRTQVELLDRYWHERIIRHDGQGDAREIVLRRTTGAMVQRRTLSIPRSAAIGNESTAGTILTDLLSTHVLAEWTTPTGAAQREILTFAHHLLFDYAAARLSIPADNAVFVVQLMAEPDLLLAIRPSIELHYQRLWHSDRSAFWDLTFQAIRTDMPEIGKLIGPSVAAVHADTVSQFQPLLDRLTHINPILRDEGMAVLRHTLNTYLANAQPASTHATLWCDLIDACTTTVTLENAGIIRPSVWHLAEHVENLNAVEFHHLGAVARRLLTYALAIAPDDRGLLNVGIKAVNETAASDLPVSIAVLRACITTERLQSMGYRTLPRLADGVAELAVHDPNYVCDLYVAALRHEDTSQEPTSMNDSQIMPFRSWRAQDYRAGLYRLGERYPAFLQKAPAFAVAALREALCLFAEEHHHTSNVRLPVAVDEYYGSLIPDGSYSWDGMGIYDHDLPITMVSHVQTHLEAFADNVQAIQAILKALTAEPMSGVAWRRLLFAGTQHPSTLGKHLRALAWDRTILTSQDTTRTAGTFIQAVHHLLNEEDRARIEQAIMTIPITGRWETRDRDRLVGCLDSAHIVSQSARERYAALTTRGGPPPNTEDHGIGRWRLIDTPLSPDPDDTLQVFIAPVKAFVGQHLNNVPDANTIAAALPRVHALHVAISTSADLLAPERATNATTELLRAATKISHAGGLTAEQCSQLLAILLSGTTHPHPETQDDDEQGRPLTGWSDAPRILASEGIVILARYTMACTMEAQAAIRRLSTDPVRAVRGQITRRLECLYHTAPDLFWELLEHYAKNEANPSMLVDVLHVLRSIPIEYAAKVSALAEHILSRTSNDTEYDDVRDAAIHVFCRLYLEASDSTCITIIERLINDPITYARDVHRLILDLSANFTTTEVNLRACVFTLLQQILMIIIAAMRGIETATSHLTSWPTELQTQFGGLLQCVDEIVRRLYYASTTLNNPTQDQASLPADAFYENARPILTQLAEMGYPHLVHHLLETLERFIDLDPAAVLILIGNVVRRGSKHGYQYEQLAEQLMVKMVEKYLAEHRPVLREQPDCHVALMNVLDSFVRVGWPRAHQLTYRLSDIYR